MKFCKKCVQPDTRPGIFFKDGVCGACLYEETKNNIDWGKREKELRKIVKWAKVKNKDYNCVIGVSGGKDSTFQSITCRDELGMRPLLVNSEPEGITEMGRKNIENLKNLGFDVISIRPNPVVMKKLIRKDFYEYLNPVKVTEFSLWSSAYIIADKFNIPLIVQGENPRYTLGTGNMEDDNDALKVYKQNTLSTGWKRYVGDGVTEKDLFWLYCDIEALKKKNIKAIWLQYYIKDWSQRHNAEFSIKHGLAIRAPIFEPKDIGTYLPFCHLDSDIVQLNQMLKYVKFGFGQCTDDACDDIRSGRITREEGIALIKKYDGKCAERYIKKFCDYLGITMNEFWKVANSFRGDMWKKDENSNWVLKDTL